MSGCLHDSGQITPKGRHISQHVLDNIAKNKPGHSVSWDYIDTVIDSAKTLLSNQTDEWYISTNNPLEQIISALGW